MEGETISVSQEDGKEVQIVLERKGED